MIIAVFVEAGGSITDKEQTLLRVQCPGLKKKSILDNLFELKLHLDKPSRMKMIASNLSLQITTRLAIVEKLISKDPRLRHRLRTVITESKSSCIGETKTNVGILVVSCC